MNSRALAARAIAAVLAKGESLSASLPRVLEHTPERDQGLVQALCYGTLRWFHRYNPLLNQLLSEPLKPKDADVQALLLLGFYQLDQLRVPDHAAIDATVDACRQLKKNWAIKLVNGVLRHYQREQDSLLAALDEQTSSRHAHPKWLIKAISQAWPDQAETIFEANNQQPPMTLRLASGNRSEYIDRLAQQNILAEKGSVAETAVELVQAVDVQLLPGFASGQVSVQDQATQLAASLLPVQPGDRVLDCCAAPGGKTLHLAQLPAKPQVTAIDIERKRLQRVYENLNRAGVKARVLCADAARPADWWDGKPFNHILLDAPCSATGVIRRHPDIKLLRKPDDIPRLAQLQAQILDAVWPLLAPGGYLLYATCSIMPAENTELTQAFLARTADAREVPIVASWGLAQTTGRQLLPGTENTDGFYYCLLTKQH